ncbi:uncharacterized protein BYT42DRAFT_41914 [Radiomyces spectabilis]|uniref:uncharacterized protein n=1 Tax=Radiomyces spectabilis TaxID=64574 RepID=UPI00221F5225|nr:uncharacterized protein BYT42DRAFT_41914 [Radiomyces spectabilis]KAI8372682.1 hypothetical protein BYT42DRAFT_41914 [Radiomyces spectabilis]
MWPTRFLSSKGIVGGVTLFFIGKCLRVLLSLASPGLLPVTFLQSFPPFFSHRVFRGFLQTHLLFYFFFYICIVSFFPVGKLSISAASNNRDLS